MAFDMGMNPNHTTASQIGFLRYTYQGQCSPTKGVARVDDSNRLLRKKRRIDRGILLVEV
jgi:hypothetical protein